MRFCQVIAAAWLALTCAVATAHAEKRVALVVGNAAYRNVSPLRNPANDARLIADTLRDLGFTLVGDGPQLNLDKASLDRAAQSFGAQLQSADIGLFYYAGHGIQLHSTNYLVPVDANIAREADVGFQMLDVNLVLQQMEPDRIGARLNVVILDACRNNPFGDKLVRGMDRGLSVMRAPEGTLISFASQPGDVALDGSGDHSPFTAALADNIRQPGRGLWDVFNDTGLSVQKATRNAQRPWVSNSPINGKFYFAGPPPPPDPPKEIVPHAESVPVEARAPSPPPEFAPQAAPASAAPRPRPKTRFGRRDDAVAMVRRVQDKIGKDGMEATFRAINQGEREFRDRDLYPFVIDFNGIERANGGVREVIGKNVIDLRDQGGKFLIRGLIVIARERGSGWYDYRWLNPKKKIVEDKSSYVERISDKNLLVGVGVYRNEQNTVRVISGSADTYLPMARDLADVLNDDDLRILPIEGIGGPRNIRDVLDVKGIDVGFTQISILNNFRSSDQAIGQNKNNIVYIAKLFDEEVHLVAGNNITSIDQLKGRKVNLDAEGSGTSYSMRDIFKTLNIDVDEVSMSQAEALEKVRSGEIAATALIAGKPVRSISGIAAAGGLHFLAVPLSRLSADYRTAFLTHDDYPAFIPAGQQVETVADGAVLFTVNWRKNGSDYQRVANFVEAFFARINEFKKPPRHPKWVDVDRAATLRGWTRFDAAQNWLDNHRVPAGQPN